MAHEARLIREILRGKGLLRSLQNIACEDITLSGRVLDVGAKAGNSSYFRFFRADPSLSVTAIDRYPQHPSVQMVDINGRFPFDDGAFSTVLLMNVLYLVQDTESCLRECHRVLKPGGRLIGAVPFVYRYVPEPEEYCRFAAAGLEQLSLKSGFSRTTVQTLGAGALSSALSLFLSIVPIPVIGNALLSAVVILDRQVLAKLLPPTSNYRRAAPLGYLFVAEKTKSE